MLVGGKVCVSRWWGSVCMHISINSEVVSLAFDEYTS